MAARILDAALAIYGATGWLGFNLDVVAKGAQVSKDALYRRWRTREALLAEALLARWDWIAAIDTGAIRSDLLALSGRALDTFAGPYGEVALQLRSDSRRFAEVQSIEEPYREQMAHQARAIVRRAIGRGDLPASARPGLIMDLLVGGIT
ncbi:MAG: TetR-like C-terminal domain-containing protein, partial [Sphingobium sp.]